MKRRAKIFKVKNTTYAMVGEMFFFCSCPEDGWFRVLSHVNTLKQYHMARLEGKVMAGWIKGEI